MQTEGQTEQRCPHCAALVRPDSPWCTLCYADLRPAPQSAAVSPSTGGEPAAAVSPSDAAIQTDAGRAATPVLGWPCQRCGGLVAIEEPTCTNCGAGFLEGGDDTDPVVRRLRGGLSNQVKAMIMVGGAAVLLLVIFGVGYLLHAVF